MGIPDCIVGLDNKFHLIELKVAQPNGKVKISPHQISFHNAHKGYPTWLFVQYDKGRKAKLFVYEGWHSYFVASAGILAPPTFECNYPWNWEDVKKCLTAFRK